MLLMIDLDLILLKTMAYRYLPWSPSIELFIATHVKKMIVQNVKRIFQKLNEYELMNVSFIIRKIHDFISVEELTVYEFKSC